MCAGAHAQDKGFEHSSEPVSAWRFSESQFTGGVVPDEFGSLNIRLQKGGLSFIGEQRHEAVLLPDGARSLLIAEDIDPSKLLPKEQFSIAAWVRMDRPQKWAGVFSAIQDNGDYERGWAAGIHSDRFYLGLCTKDGNGITYLFSNRLAEPGRWYHFVATYNGSRMRIYIDGALDVESTEQSGPISWPKKTTLTLGAYQDDDERHPLLGALHSVELHDRALDESQVATSHSRFSGAFPEPETPEDYLRTQAAEEIVGWPTYRHDPQRSGATQEQLNFPLQESWVFSSSPPKPSWPEPAQRSYWQNVDEVVPRVVFDLAHHPVSNGEVVIYGSSSDDHVRCIDLATGNLRWKVATDGPVRFAPLIDGEGVVVASDDGHLYRFQLADGSLVWKTRLAPEDRRIPGNGRLISNWPIRTGPVIDRGLLHATSGLFPRFGTRAFAIDPKTGEIVWEQVLPNTSPQGYLLASPTRLFVPTGRTSPSMLGRGDGRAVGSFDLPGGTFALLVEDELVSGPGSEGNIVPANIRTRETAAGFRADRGIVVPELIILQRGTSIRALDRARLLTLREARTELLAQQSQLEAAIKTGDTTAATPLSDVRKKLEQNLLQLESCELWEIEFDGNSLALAGGDLVIGGKNEVVALNATNGEERWRAPLEGRAWGLAVAGGHLLVATDRGKIYAFGNTTPDAVPTQQPEKTTSHRQALTQEQLQTIREAGMDRGIAIVVQPVDGGSAFQLVKETDMHVVVLSNEHALIDQIRQHAIDQGIYGKDLVAHVTDSSASPFIDGIANLIIVEEGLSNQNAPVCGPEILRLLRPAGGILLGSNDPKITNDIRLRQIPNAGCVAWEREALPGADNWTHPYANASNTTASSDTRIGGETALQWFGGPGPARMVDRHLRTTASLAHRGRLFIPGNDTIIAVDAYNGSELWETPLKGFTRTGAPYDGGWWAVCDEGVFAATPNNAAQLDPRNGELIDTHGVPTEAQVDGATDWGWLALDEGILFGSAAIPSAARREQNRDAVVEQYKEFRPIATSRALFAIDPESNTTQWVYRGGIIPNSAIALKDDRVFFLESKTINSKLGRIDLATLGNAEIQLVALNTTTGEELWRSPLDMYWEHSIYLACADDGVVLVGSFNENQQNQYRIEVFDPDTGEHRWSATQNNNREGVGGDHGEQVHHPVIVGEMLVAEPLVYDLSSGNVIDPTSRDGFSIRSRSGCGTISASASCLFFRDANPTMVKLGDEGGTWQKLTHSSRPGCWVNIIPSQGLILLPESSAGCLCGYSLQTSMALVPLTHKN